MSGVHEGFLRYRNYRWLKLAALLLAACIGLYAWHDPVRGAGGNTWLGYTLGTMAALLVVWLAWLGVRKRRYRSTLGPVRGWVSAHVYLGMALLVIASLHSGFQFGWNIHTLAYALMVGVVASGLYGVAAYSRLPQQITAHRRQETRDAWLAEITDLNEQALRLADSLDPEIHRMIVRSTERLQLGGSVWQQLFPPRPRHEELQALAQRASKGPARDPSLDTLAGGTVMFMASRIMKARGSAGEAERARQLLDLLGRRNQLAQQLNEDLRLHAWLQIWLFLHVPLTLGLLAALAAHVLSVFIYR